MLEPCFRCDAGVKLGLVRLVRLAGLITLAESMCGNNAGQTPNPDCIAWSNTVALSESKNLFS